MSRAGNRDMMGLLSKFFGGDDALTRDADRIYRALMDQSRNPAFYGGARVPDTQEGRLELLVLHVATVMQALRELGEDGKKLSQALFDTLKDDLDVALREEGYSDSGVKRRIKPMITRFYAGLKAYSEAFDAGDDAGLAAAINLDLEEMSADYAAALAAYARELLSGLRPRTLGEIASVDFAFPASPAA